MRPVVILAASVLSALSPDLLILDIGRPLADAGSAAVVTGASALLSSACDGARRAAPSRFRHHHRPEVARRQCS